ncbi:MAG TPA: DUF4129 domain-containing protein, partial [Thermoanaerobaculia bacterium]|nr:DUF4129 domain-containing protein [Thermoanaerobaculia bacterium]
MNLDETTVVIRPRQPAEAVDLGYRLVRAWWRPVYAAWLTLALPLWAIGFLVGHRMPWLVLLVLWWLRPLADRAALFVVSHGVFSDFPGWRRTLRSWPGLWRRQLWATLFLLRLDPARSFHLPVFQLERLSGQQLRTRFKVLNSQGVGQAVMLTIASAWIELCLFFAALAFVGMLLPGYGMGDAIGEGFVALGGGEPQAVALLAFAAFTAHALTAPAWVAGGFTLYLSARTRLEGWDVQLAFRRLANRLRQSSAAMLVLALLAAPLFASTLFAIPVHAQEPAAAEE